jgi:hypothetical protein
VTVVVLKPETRLSASPPGSTRWRRARRVCGALRFVIATLVALSVIAQVGDLAYNNAFVPMQYFSFFTIQSGVLSVVVYGVGTYLALSTEADPRGYTTLRMSALSWSAVTGVVFAALLQNIPSPGYVGLQWPNDVLHVIVPLLVTVEWLYSPGRAALRWGSLWAPVSFPLVWLAGTLLHGLSTGWYPYPFLDPASDGGHNSVIAYIVAIALVILTIASLAIVISRITPGMESPRTDPWST